MSPPLHGSEAHCCIVNQVMCITRFFYFFFHIARQYCYYWVVIIAYLGTWKKVGFLLSLSTSQRWGWWTSWAWPSNALLWKEDSTALWIVLGWASPTGEGWWSSPSTLVRSVWSTVSSSGLPSRHTGVWDLLVHGDIKIQIELGKVLSNLL